jgi:multidrug efflux system membrane fusion protein
VRATYITAAIIALLVVGWILSGVLAREEIPPAPSLADVRNEMTAIQDDREPTRVRARVMRATIETAEVALRGRTESNRMVEVRAETSGRVVALPVEKGALVKAGDVLCRIAVEDRPARLTEAREAVAQAQLEYQGSLKLKRQGYQSETAIASAKARLAATEALLKRRELDLENTEIRAPFDGIVEEQPVEIGDYLQVGTQCATVVDNDPMLLVGNISERAVNRLALDGPARAKLLTGEQVDGHISYIAQVAQETTRTYRVEIEVPNPNYTIRSGITADIAIPVATFSAHQISPALLALDDAGNIGVRILDENNIVRFVQVEIVKDDPTGVWVSGLPEVATIITVGQELVVAGEKVEVTYDASEMPASAPRLDPGAMTTPSSTSAPMENRLTSAT